MKKIFLLFFGLISGVFIWFTFFVKSPSKIEGVVLAECTANIAERMVANNLYRNKWLPKEGKITAVNKYELNGCEFEFIADVMQNTLLKVSYKKINVSSFIQATTQGDKALVSISFNTKFKNNLISKLKNSTDNKTVEKSVTSILVALQQFVNKNENIYGVEMKKAILKDSTLISIKTTTKNNPSIAEIYSKIDLLEAYARNNGAAPTNPPMLNIYKVDSGTYFFMVALPINKWLNDNGEIIGKRMLAGGNILETGEIKGGFETVNNYLKELENFKTDRNEISPAIPYQSLVTNRLIEKDTSKWITKLYFPVF